MKKSIVLIVYICVILFSLSSCGDTPVTVKMPVGQWTLATTFMDAKRADVKTVVASNFANISKKETTFTFYENGVFIEKSKIGLIQSGSISFNGGQKITFDYDNLFTKGVLIQTTANQFEIQLETGKTMIFEKLGALATQ
jgi:hypothetical protein